ncbi:beta-propeller domain-containing protein [Pendulispora albinea]|uniref:Beta-propeller domain-containing protein n=1 Tax=Pendulispora albinea TaxID=2741071 RepID=A0ABZ2MBX2_9BACT
MKRLRLAGGILMACALAASCAPPSARPAPASSSAHRDAPHTGAGSAPAPAPGRFVHRAHPPVAQRPPPPVVTAPMKGEPSGAALAEARLVTVSREQASRDDIEARVKAMRVALENSFASWQNMQPYCGLRGKRWPRRVLRPSEFSDKGIPSSMPAPTASASAPAQRAPAGPAPNSTPAKGAASKSEAPKAGSASGTNNQVAGVDEADIVKTDGRYVYFAMNGALRIAEALDPRMLSVTQLPGTVRDLFVEGDRAVVYTSSSATRAPCTYGYDCEVGGDGSATTVHVYDVSNRASPKRMRQIELSGSFIAARRIGNAVHTVVADGEHAGLGYAVWPSGLSSCGTPAATVRAAFAKLKAENERVIRASSPGFPSLREKGIERLASSAVMRTGIHDGTAFTTVVSFDLRDDNTPATTAILQSRPGAVFASDKALYMSVTHRKRGAGHGWYSFYASTDEVSDIHELRIGADPRDTKYVGSGVVPGHILNQFAMDEWSGYLRVATTSGRVPDPKVSSTVSILAKGQGGNLTRVGAVGQIAPGEDIRAVRFDQDRGYVVTFKKTDPLFVLDLYPPAQPSILGELEIPGFSTYMHRIDPDHLLSIGFDANDHGDFAYFDGVILQLFDVKNPTEPKLVHKEKIGSRGSSSQAATDHLAFNYFADKGLLAVPMTICEGGGDGISGDTLAFSGLLIYDVDTEKGFTRLGGVDHGTKGVNCNTWWSQARSAVKRSIFLDDLVYSIAEDRAKVQRMESLGVDLADLRLY